VKYIVVIVMLCSTVAAQQGRQISGQVSDVTGAAIAHAIVTIRANGSSTIATVQTDQTGKFVSAGLAPKLYDLLFQASGFEAVALTKRIDASHDITIPLIKMVVADIGGVLPDSKKKR
jgi:hypothetical protein